MSQTNAATTKVVSQERYSRDMLLLRELDAGGPSTNLSDAAKEFLADSVVRPLRGLLEGRPALSLKTLQEGNLECVERLLSSPEADIEYWQSSSMRCLNITRPGSLDFLKVVSRPEPLATVNIRLQPEESRGFFPTLSGDCNGVQLIFEVSGKHTNVFVQTIASGDVLGRPMSVGSRVALRPEALAQAGWDSHLSHLLFRYLAEPAIHYAIKGKD